VSRNSACEQVQLVGRLEVGWDEQVALRLRSGAIQIVWRPLGATEAPSCRDPERGGGLERINERNKAIWSC